MPPSAIHIGVWDEINYAKAGDPASNGQQAASEINSIEQSLGVKLGSPFVWVRDPSTLGDPTSQASKFAEAFNKAMIKLTRK